ncbi:MAG: gamma-glutamyltransferase family protein [Candidatus Brocadiae bacterium]|nr:gamma-glutamyltransferase family protein [Candidatus Brocadiia bacterium]
MIMCRHGVASAGHYLGAEAGLHILRAGGNAMDAAAAVSFALAVLEPHLNGVGGEVPVLLYSASDGRAHAVSGHGVAPAAATIERFRELGIEDAIPGDGFLPALVPPFVDTWTTVLARFGTMRLTDVLTPALDLAEKGFAVGNGLHGSIAKHADRLRSEWPSSAAKFLPGGEPPAVGTVWRQPELAATFRKLIEAEAAHRKRELCLRAARDRFYLGDIAEAIVNFAAATPVKDASGQEHTCLLTLDDLADFSARVEEPVAVSYKGIEVHKCSSWTQGPVLLQALKLLEGFAVAEMEHNSADYIHAVVECMKLAYADREFYYGDPEFADVPFDRLLSEDYAAERRGLVDMKAASMLLRPGGYEPLRAENVRDVLDVFVGEGAWKNATGDTTKLEVADGDGNMVSSTPSGGWLMSSPVIPGVGFPLGTRGQMFSLVAGHPNSLEPGKRPRMTLTPSLATRDGSPYLAFGSPGGDCQDQWALQFFLNVVEFGMSLQEAAEAPTFFTGHFPSSFYPRGAEPGVLYVEGRIPDDVRIELQNRGHILKVRGDWSSQNALAAMSHDGLLTAAASPRPETSYALGW